MLCVRCGLKTIPEPTFTIDAAGKAENGREQRVLVELNIPIFITTVSAAASSWILVIPVQQTIDYHRQGILAMQRNCAIPQNSGLLQINQSINQSV